MKKLLSFYLVIIPFALLILVTSCKKSSSSSLPLVGTIQISSIDSTTAKSGGNIFSEGSDPVTARGVCWSRTTTPTIADNKTIDGSGSGSFSSSITGLTQGSYYAVRAYATNINGTSYGEVETFNTLSSTPGTPIVITLPASNITGSSATLNGSIDASFALPDTYFEYGLDNNYGTAVHALLKSVRTNVDQGSAKSSKAMVQVTTVISALDPLTTYHFRVVVYKNGAYVTVGQEYIFSTTPY